VKASTQCCAGLLALAVGGGLQAQSAESIEALQDSVALYAAVLQEGLGLNARAGIFSPTSGSVRGLYLARQGVVLEVMSPLASARNSFAQFSLGAALERLSAQFAAQSGAGPDVPRPDLSALRETMALSLRAEFVQGQARDLLDELTRVDVSAEISAALQSAGDAARSLHALTQFNDAALNQVLEETSAQRAQLSGHISAMQALRAEIGTQVQPLTQEQVAQWRTALQSLSTALQSLQAAAQARADALQAQAGQARAQREAQWQLELAAFETSLIRLVCDYAGGLRALPAQEHVTIVLQGLGDDAAQRREDRIVVLRQADALRCLQGEITAAQLQQTAQVYSF
jgi:hypothetical protein